MGPYILIYQSKVLKEVRNLTLYFDLCFSKQTFRKIIRECFPCKISESIMVTQVASKAVVHYQGGSMLKGKEKSSTPAPL